MVSDTQDASSDDRFLGDLKDAQQLARQGQREEALVQMTRLVEERPDCQPVIEAMALTQEALGKRQEAADNFQHLAALAPDNPHLAFKCGTLWMNIDRQRFSYIAKAQHWFEKAISLDPEMATAHYHLALVLTAQGHQVESIPPLERAIAIDPGMPHAQYYLAQAYIRVGRTHDARECLRATLNVDPVHDGALQTLRDLDSAAGIGLAKRVSYFPSRLLETDLQEAVERHVLEESYPAILKASSKVATFGSCFAGNIARSLNQMGISTSNTTFGESINSTAANVRYMDWLTENESNDASEALIEYHKGDPSFSADPAKHRQLIRQSDLIILTVGVAPAFFDNSTGKVAIPARGTAGLRAMMKTCTFRTTTVAENVTNLSYIFDTLTQLNPDARIVVTVSPAPLTATFEYKSAVVADCVSKSTLRVAVDEAIRQRPEAIVYWPSFEIVRWLGAYYPGMYGADDGSTAHVSEKVIDLIVGLFIDRLSDGTLKSRFPARKS